MRTARPRWGILASCVLASCSEPAVAPGEPWFVSDGTQGTELQVDLGKVLVGDALTRVLTLENRGASTLRVVSVTASAEKSGLGVKPFVLPLSVQPTDEARLELFFAPEAAGAATVDLTFELEDATVKSAVLHLAGTALDPACTLEPGQLAFGTVALASDAARSFKISNGSELGWRVLLGEIDGDRVFSVTGQGSALDVPAHGSAEVWLRFAAFDLGTFRAALPLSGKARCTPSRVELSGTAVEQVLTFVPATVDFGAVALGATGSRTVIFSNASSRDVDLSGLSVTSQDLGFGVVQAEAVTVKAGASASVDVEFAPTKEASYTGTLQVLTTEPSRAEISIPVSGSGVTP